MKILVHACMLLLYALVAPGQDAAQSSMPELVRRAEGGDAKAQFDLGRAYEDGNGIAQNDDRAVEWFRKSAEQGNAQALNSLGVMYALGRGVRRDKEEAVRWYKKAAKLGLPEAIYNVAISYYNGEGVASDLVTAYAWMMIAQTKGDSQAAEALRRIGEELHYHLDRSKGELAELYERGEEVPQDLPAAAALYLEIAKHDFQEGAQFKMCQLYVLGKGVPQDYVQAAYWCKKSRLPFAYMILGQLAEQGLGREKNLHDAMELYKQAAVLGIAEGYMNTGRLKLEAAPHNETNAYFWYSLAVKRKIPGANEKLAEVAGHLSEKEIAEQKKQVEKCEKMPEFERTSYLKKH